jgi:rSAM/selenodomain-associated transferase 1
MRARIVIFAKAPVAGQVKTRLIPALGAEGAAALAHRMLLETYNAASSVRNVAVEICVSPAASDPAWRGLLPPGAKATDQGEGDLGARLARAAQRVLGEGESVVFVGTDCPDLTCDRLHEACVQLEGHDAVIHGALDGGYVLLGLKRFDASLFSDIAWSTSSVAAATIARIANLGWSLHVGESLRDLDEPEDLLAVFSGHAELVSAAMPEPSRCSKMDPEASSG